MVLCSMLGVDFDVLCALQLGEIFTVPEYICACAVLTDSAEIEVGLIDYRGTKKKSLA